MPSSSNVEFNRKNSSQHSNSTQNYLIKYPNTSTVFPCSKSSASIKSLYFSNSNNNINNNSNIKLANIKQDVNVYDEIITSDQEENENDLHRPSQNRKNFAIKTTNSTNDYELLSNLNSSINSNNTSLNSSLTNRSSMICMNNNRINSLASCNNLQNKITSTINCFKSFGKFNRKKKLILFGCTPFFWC